MSEDQQKWVTKLIGLNFEIQDQPELENKVTDVLSKRCKIMEQSAISLVCFWGMEDLENAIQQNDTLKNITQDIQQLLQGFSFFSHGKAFEVL